MDELPQINPLSETFLDSISNSIAKLYREGNYALVLVFIGTLFLLVALFFGHNIVGYTIGALGCITILTVLYFFYTRDIRPLKQENDNMQRNQAIVDTFQEAANQLARTANDLHTFTIIYASEVSDFIVQYQQRARDIGSLAKLLKVPGSTKIEQLADSRYVTKTKDLSVSILSFTHETETALKEIQFALAKSDIEPIKKYLSQIEELDQKLKQLLKTESSPVQPH